MICGQSFAICAEVGIMADSAFVSITHNAEWTFVDAQRTIAVDAIVALRVQPSDLYRLTKWDEAMTWMYLASRLDANGAVVPVRTVEAFMTYAIYILLPKLERFIKDHPV